MRLPPARATNAIVIVTSVAWLVATVLGTSATWAYLGGFVPARVVGGPTLAGALPVWLTPLTATLLHGGLAHVALNMMMILFCGRFVETAIGARGLVLLYVLGAYAAASVQYLLSPGDMTPMVGASGAGSALLGTYAILYGARPAEGRGPLSPGLLNLIWLAAAWIGLQLLFGFAMRGEGIGVAIGAHIGGFVAGLLLARPLLILRFGRAGPLTRV